MSKNHCLQVVGFHIWPMDYQDHTRGLSRAACRACRYEGQHPVRHWEADRMPIPGVYSWAVSGDFWPRLFWTGDFGRCAVKSDGDFGRFAENLDAAVNSDGDYGRCAVNSDAHLSSLLYCYLLLISDGNFGCWFRTVILDGVMFKKP